MNSGIYTVTNAMTGSQYVGSAVNFNQRWAVHIHHLKKGTHHSKYLQNAWNLYGEDAFEFDVILRCAHDRLIVHEQGAIDHLKPAYNMSPTAGSQLGMKHTAEARAKISAIQTGKSRSPHTPEAKAKMSAAHKNRTPETRANMSKAAKNRTPEARANISNSRLGNTNCLGRKYTAETRAKISKARIGKSCSPEHRAAISATTSGRKQSPDHIAKRVASFKRNRAAKERGITLHTQYDQGAS